MEKKGNLKKVIFVIIILVIGVIGVFWYLSYQNGNESMVNAMEKASKDYFDNYMSSNTGASAYDVTLEMLKEANEDDDAGYDLSELKGCNEKTTKAILTINYSNGEVKNTEVVLDCKKF